MESHDRIRNRMLLTTTGKVLLPRCVIPTDEAVTRLKPLAPPCRTARTHRAPAEDS